MSLTIVEEYQASRTNELPQEVEVYEDVVKVMAAVHERSIGDSNVAASSNWRRIRLEPQCWRYFVAECVDALHDWCGNVAVPLVVCQLRSG